MHFSFFLGVLGLLQASFLPGQILLQPYKQRLPLLARLAYGLCLSVVANYIIGAVLLLLGWLTQPVLISIIAVEMIVLFIMSWRSPIVAQPFWYRLIACRSTLCHHSWGCVAFYGALLSLLAYTLLVINHYGQVFYVGDDLFSWNSWAHVLAAGHIPKTQGYPLLFPMNQAMIYVLMGTLPQVTILFFSVLFMALFPLACLLILWDECLRQPSHAKALGVVLIGALFAVMQKRYVGSGYVDIPTACLGFAAVMGIVRVSEQELPPSFLMTVVGLIAAGAMVGKQAGSLAGIVVLIMTGIWYQWRWRIALVQVLLFLLIGASWYGFYFCFYDPHGMSMKVHELTQGMYGHDTIMQRLWHAAHLLKGFYWICFLLSLVAMIISRQVRWLVLLTVVLGSVIWAYGFSYDDRNIAMVLPFLGFTAAIGLVAVLKTMACWNLRKLSIHWWGLIALILLVVLSQLKPFSLSKMQRHQDRQFIRMLTPESTVQMLLGYKKLHGFSGKIATNWPSIRYIPGVKQYAVWVSDSELAVVVHLRKVHYVLADRDSSWYPIAQQLVRKGELQPVSYANDVVLYQVK
jgi:hypothetical protein